MSVSTETRLLTIFCFTISVSLSLGTELGFLWCNQTTTDSNAVCNNAFRSSNIQNSCRRPYTSRTVFGKESLWTGQTYFTSLNTKSDYGTKPEATIRTVAVWRRNDQSSSYLIYAYLRSVNLYQTITCERQSEGSWSYVNDLKIDLFTCPAIQNGSKPVVMLFSYSNLELCYVQAFTQAYYGFFNMPPTPNQETDSDSITTSYMTTENTVSKSTYSAFLYSTTKQTTTSSSMYSNINKELAIILSLAIGLPLLAAIIAISIYFIRKQHQHFNNNNKLSAPKSLPVLSSSVVLTIQADNYDNYDQLNPDFYEGIYDMTDDPQITKPDPNRPPLPTAPEDAEDGYLKTRPIYDVNGDPQKRANYPAQINKPGQPLKSIFPNLPPPPKPLEETEEGYLQTRDKTENAYINPRENMTKLVTIPAENPYDKT